MKTYHNGRFGGLLDSSTEIRFSNIIRWKLLERKSAPKREIKPLEVIDNSEQLSGSGDFICWLSHASFLIQLGGRRILIDPLFTHPPLYKRHSPFPYDIGQLGKIDYLLLSHAHYDHFDTPSIRAVAHHRPKAVVPLQMGKALGKILADIATHELDWYESYSENGLTITLVPAKHWSKRTPFDTNRILWGGYIIEYNGLTIYFAGDSASGEHFDDIGSRFDIDIALMPIGAYRPEYIMKHNHINPQEAYDAFRQLRAKTMIPMHYGTFRLSDEPIDEPLEWMERIASEHPGEIRFLRSGEVLEL